MASLFSGRKISTSSLRSTMWTTPRDYGEVRYNAIGWLDALLHTLTFTQDGEAIHAISLRKATRQEQKTYDEES